MLCFVIIKLTSRQQQHWLGIEAAQESRSRSVLLCAEPQRYFSGSLAHLGLFDSALSSLQVQRLYESYIAPGEQPA